MRTYGASTGIDPVIVSSTKKKRNKARFELFDFPTEKTIVTGKRTLKSRARTPMVFEGMHRRIE